MFKDSGHTSCIDKVGGYIVSANVDFDMATIHSMNTMRRW